MISTESYGGTCNFERLEFFLVAYRVDLNPRLPIPKA